MAGYLGNAPTAVPLSSADLQDGIITSAKIANGAIVGDDINSTFNLTGKTVTLPAGTGGKVLQVVSATDSTRRDTTSSSFVTASNTLSVTLTPSSTSNKIFLISHFTQLASANNFYTFYRGATNIGHSSYGLGHSSNSSHWMVQTISYLDSPSSTSSLTYQVYFRSTSGTAYIVTDQSGGIASITAFEIAG